MAVMKIPFEIQLLSNKRIDIDEVEFNWSDNVDVEERHPVCFAPHWKNPGDWYN